MSTNEEAAGQVSDAAVLDPAVATKVEEKVETAPEKSQETEEKQETVLPPAADDPAPAAAEAEHTQIKEEVPAVDAKQPEEEVPAVDTKQPEASDTTQQAPPNDGTGTVVAPTVAEDAAVAVQAAAVAVAAAQSFVMPPQAVAAEAAGQPTAHGNYPMTDPMHPLPPSHMAIPMALDGSTQPSTIKLPIPPVPMPTGPRPTDLPCPNEEEVDLTCFPYEIILGKDVISGKGGKVQQVNRHFRNMVAAEYHMYDSTASKISKRKIGLKIYQQIIDVGGRFLDHDGNPMDQPKAVLKVMKALKDAKTWTSDAKRNAKRRREESGGGVESGAAKKMPAKRARRASGTLPTATLPAAQMPPMMVKTDIKEEGEEGDGNGLNLLYQAMDGEKVDV